MVRGMSLPDPRQGPRYLQRVLSGGVLFAAEEEAVEDDDFDCEKVLGSNDHEKIATEFRSTVAKAAMQKEHNAQLLVRILKLQGNIQVCCRVRPLWKDEIKTGMKRGAEQFQPTRRNDRWGQKSAVQFPAE